jgi:hypothetical protein
MNAKQYAVIDEYKGGFVGSLEEIVEWLMEHSCIHGQQKFYEIGEEVVPMFGMEKI